MNERIEKLAELCWVTIPCDFNMDHDGLSTLRTIFDRKKFAELIVKECANKVSGMVMRDKFDTIPKDPHSQGWNEAVGYAGKELKRHFGVE